MKYLVVAHKRFIYYTLLCLKAKYVTCIKSVTAGRLGTTHLRFTVYRIVYAWIRKVNKNNLLGGQVLIYLCPKTRENNELGGQPLIFERSNPINVFFSRNFKIYYLFNCHHPLIHNRISWTGVLIKVCWYCPTNLLTNFRIALTYCLWCSSGIFPFGVGQFCQKLGSKFSIFNNCGAYFSVGKMIYWVDNFGQWAGWIYWMGKLI